MKIYQVLIYVLMICQVTSGSWWDDAWNKVKNAASTVDTVFKDAGVQIKNIAINVGDEIVKRFQDTQTTRAIDFGIQIAALETAKTAAIAAQKTAMAASLTSIRAGKATTLGSLTAAQQTLDKVGRPVSDAALSGAREAAHVVLEGAKIASVGTLDASKWVADNVLGQFDITKIEFKGSLDKLKQGSLAQTHIEGTLFQKDFSGDIDLSVKSAEDVFNSCKPYIERAVQEIKNFFENTAKSLNPLLQHQAEIDAARQAMIVTQSVTIVNPDQQAAVITQALTTADQSIKIAQQAIYSSFDEAQKKLNEFAQKTTDDLKKIASQQATGQDEARARQEIARRARQ